MAVHDVQGVMGTAGAKLMAELLLQWQGQPGRCAAGAVQEPVPCPVGSPQLVSVSPLTRTDHQSWHEEACSRVLGAEQPEQPRELHCFRKGES
jgi:hypothetical protein